MFSLENFSHSTLVCEDYRGWGEGQFQGIGSYLLSRFISEIISVNGNSLTLSCFAVFVSTGYVFIRNNVRAYTHTRTHVRETVC